MPHVLSCVCIIHVICTEIPCLEMSGSNDMAVLSQVCFQTLFVVRHLSAIPNRILLQERNGSTTAPKNSHTILPNVIDKTPL